MNVSNLPKTMSNANVCACNLAAVGSTGGICGFNSLRVTQQDVVSYDLRAKVVIGTTQVLKERTNN